MASVPSGSGGASSQFGQLGKAPQLKEQLYNPDAKLTDLFGSLEPKMMLDAIISTYCKKKRARLPWYFYVGSGPDAEKKRSFVRDSSNSGRKLATVMALKRSVQEKGVVEDARGRMWVIDREDPESPYTCLSWGHLTEAVYLADQQSQENTTPNAMVSKSIDQGVEAEVFEAMPNEAREFLVKFHNSVDDRRELMEQMKLVKKAEAAWRHHRQNIGATGRALGQNYETEYWKFISNRYVGVWRSFRAFDSCKVTTNMIVQLGLLDYVYESFNNGVDIFRSGFTPENTFQAMHNLLSMLTQSLADCPSDHRIYLETLAYESLKFCVPWLDEAPSPVDWLFDRPRPDLGSRLIFNMAKTSLVTGGSTGGKRSATNGAAAAAKRRRTATGSTEGGLDTLRMTADHVINAVAGDGGRCMTFADMLIDSVVFVVHKIDAEFANAATSIGMTHSLVRRVIGPYFSEMLHFAWTGKKQIGGKSVTALSKVKGPAMAELMNNLLKACLPNFASVQSNETLVDRLHCFLQQQESDRPQASASVRTRGGGGNSDAEDHKLKALVFFATEGLGMKPMVHGEENKTFGTKLKSIMDLCQEYRSFRDTPLMKNMMVSLVAGCSCGKTEVKGECAYHHASANIMDMTYDVAKVLFAQYPMMVQDWIQSVATAYAQSWELPAILKNVGVVADTVLLFQSLRDDRM